jgi:hypothetical protein
MIWQRSNVAGALLAAAVSVVGIGLAIDNARAAETIVAPANDDDDLDLLEKLGLLEGHLLIGKQLVDTNKVRDGLPHFGHPVSEIYDYIKPQLDKRRAVDFYPALRALEDQVRRVGGGAQTTAQYNEVVAAVEKARESVALDQRRSPKFMLRVVALLLEDAASDYEESIEKGRISNKVEYHDAMGFIQHVDRLVRDIRASAGPEWTVRLKQVGDEVAAAAKAFPALDPPAKPARTVRSLKASAAHVLALAK